MEHSLVEFKLETEMSREPRTGETMMPSPLKEKGSNIKKKEILRTGMRPGNWGFLKMSVGKGYRHCFRGIMCQFEMGRYLSKASCHEKKSRTKGWKLRVLKKKERIINKT